ncbi:MAG: TIGR02996 domain-containing protein [Planctomycetia bacterium]|nr:TIGR02996 domain-containing protein [Planctomycetia bacterium]
MHPEADAFLDVIFDHPDDDTPRLVYADWLQEHDQENYAQFIRLQCAVAGEKPWSDEANRLWVEIGRVWNWLDEEWWPATRDAWLSGWGWQLLDAVHFKRGFPRSSFSATDDQFHRYLVEETCWPWFPHPDCEMLLTSEGDWETLAAFPQLRQLKQLRFAVYTDDGWDFVWVPDEIIGLLRSPHLCRLETLDLSARCLTQRVVNILLSASNLSSIERLVVHFYERRDHYDPPEAVVDPEEAVLQLKSRFKWVIQH